MCRLGVLGKRFVDLELIGDVCTRKITVRSEEFIISDGLWGREYIRGRLTRPSKRRQP